MSCHAVKGIISQVVLLHLLKNLHKIFNKMINVVINTDCEGACYRIYARQKFQIMPERCTSEQNIFITIIKTGLSGFKKYPFIFMR